MGGKNSVSKVTILLHTQISLAHPRKQRGEIMARDQAESGNPRNHWHPRNSGMVWQDTASAATSSATLPTRQAARPAALPLPTQPLQGSSNSPRAPGISPGRFGRSIAVIHFRMKHSAARITELRPSLQPLQQYFLPCEQQFTHKPSREAAPG